MTAANDTNPSNYRYTTADPGHMQLELLRPLLECVASRAPTTVLDVGSGNGYLASQIQGKLPQCQVHGLEPSSAGVEIATRSFPNVSFRQGSLYDPPPAEWVGAFDVVISTEVIEHLYRPDSLVEFIDQVLKPSGTAIISTPYHGYWKNLALSVCNKWDHHHTVFWEHGHIKFWSRKTLEKLFENHGYHAREFIGVGRLPYLWKTMLMAFERNR